MVKRHGCIDTHYTGVGSDITINICIKTIAQDKEHAWKDVRKDVRSWLKPWRAAWPLVSRRHHGWWQGGRARSVWERINGSSLSKSGFKRKSELHEASCLLTLDSTHAFNMLRVAFSNAAGDLGKDVSISRPRYWNLGHEVEYLHIFGLDSSLGTDNGQLAAAGRCRRHPFLSQLTGSAVKR